MFNYLYSEVYRTFRHRALWVFFLFSVFILILLALFSMLDPEVQSVKGYLDLVYIGIILGAIAFSVAFTYLNRKEKGIHTQFLAYGLNRNIVFVGDFFLICVSIFLTGFVIILVAVSIAFLLYGHQPYVNGTVGMFVYKVGNVYLVLIPLVTMALSLSYLISNIAMAIAAFYFSAYVVPGLLLNLTMNSVINFIIKLMPANYLLNDLSFQNSIWFRLSILSNFVVWFIVAGIAYNKKEF